MALDPQAKRRWKERRIGNVALSSPRGILALSLLGLAILLALSNPVLVTIEWLRGAEPETQQITTELLMVNFAFNAVILVLLPVAGLAVARPKTEAAAPATGWMPIDGPGKEALPRIEVQGSMPAVIERLGLGVDRRTPLWILIGSGSAIASILALGAIIYLFTQLGFSEPEQSPLIDDISALLTWPLVFFIPLVASLTEEIFFRGLLQPRIGLVASSVFFGIVHVGYGTWLQVVAPFLIGLLFGFLFQRSRSLWSAIAAHYTFDFVQLIALMLSK